jgi:chromosome segregation ATPase
LKIPVLETDIEEFRQAIDDLEKSNDDKTRRITELEAAVYQLQEKLDSSTNQVQNTDNSIIQLEDSSDKQRRQKNVKKDEVNKKFLSTNLVLRNFFILI